MSSGPSSSCSSITIQSGPNPWNQEEEQNAIEKSREEAAKRKRRQEEEDDKAAQPISKRKRTERSSKRKRNGEDEKGVKTKKARTTIRSHSVPGGESSSTNDSTGTIPSPTAVDPVEKKEEGCLLKEFNQLRTKYEALRNRYRVLRNDATSRPPLNKKLKLRTVEEDEEEEEEEELYGEEDWFFILARL